MRRALSSGGARELIRRHRPDYQIVIYIGVLLLIGLVVLYAISPARVELLNFGGDAQLDQTHFMQRQFLYLIMGIGAFVIGSSIPLRVWQKYAGKLLLVSLAACLLLVILGATSAPLALCSGGACRWFDLGFTTFQPAELVKFSMLLFCAGFLGKRVAQGKVNDVQETIIPLCLLIGVSILFIIGFQKDMGTGLALLGIIGTMLYIAGINKRIGAFLLGLAIVVGLLFILIAPHRIARVTTFLGDSPADARGSSYHITQAKIALGTGGLVGLGLGKNVQAGESPGIIIAPDKEQGNNVRYANMAFGQGLDVTMLQVVTAFSAAINGGTYYKPSVLAGTTNKDGILKPQASKVVQNNVLQPGISAQLKDMIVEARQIGAFRGKDRSGYQVGGKTGTSQIIDPATGKYTDENSIGSYLGFGGNQTPHYVIMIQVKDSKAPGYAGTTAAGPIFTDISNWLIDYLKITPSN